MKNRLFISLLIVATIAPLAHAQETTPDHKFFIELNPLAYAFNGWSIGGAYQPARLNQWVFNTAVYRFQMPEMFVEQIPGNEDKGFELEIHSAVTAGAEFYPWNQNRSGVSFGLSAVLATFDVTNKNEPGEARYSSFYVVPRLQYTWFVFKDFYVMPWVGVEFHNKIRGDTQVGRLNFEPMTTQFSPNITIGYSFN